MKKFGLLLTGLLAVLLVCGCGDNAAGKNGKVRVIRDLNSSEFTIGGMTGIVATREAQTRLPKAQLKEYSMPIDAFTAICSRKVDAVVLDRPTLEFMSLAHPELAVMKDDLAVGRISVAAARRNTELMRNVNQFIRRYRADGTYQAMIDRWFHTRDADMPEIRPLDLRRGVLKVGVTANNEPLCFIKNGKLAGFDSEFSRRLAAWMGREIEFVDMPYDALVIGLESGKIDLAVAFMDAMPEREESVLFSEYYIDAPITMLVRRELLPEGMYQQLADLKGKTVGTLTGSAYDLLAKKYMPEHELKSFSQLNQAVAALETRKIDAFFVDSPIARFLLAQRPGLAEVPEKIPCGDYAMVFPRNTPELCAAFSRELKKMRENGTMTRLQDKWFSADEQAKFAPELPSGSRVLKMGVIPEMQPFAYVKDGEITGYEVELAVCAARRLGYGLKIVPADYVTFAEAAMTGKVDFVCGCITATAERAEKILFSERIYDGGISVIVRKNQTAPEQSFLTWCGNAGRSLAESFEKTFIRESRWKLILQGLWTTIFITFFAVVLGTVLAFPVCKMCRSRRKIVAWLGDRYVSLIMGTPILVILMILYYVVFAKVDISGIVVAILAFAMDFAAYTSVMLRSGIEGIPRGQTEAALALGHRPHAAFLRFILPQAIRTVLPVYRGEIISTLKATSVVGYIAIMDLTKMGDIIRSRTYDAFFPLIAIALIYFLTAKCLTAILLVIEKRLEPDSRRRRLQKRGLK